MQKLYIIGTGLIGGSIAKKYRTQHPDAIIQAIDINNQSLELLQEEGAINAGFSEINAYNLQNADIIIIATQPQYWQQISEELMQNLQHKPKLIMDVGSVKQYAQTCFEKLPNFVPTHPIAGSEFSGAAFSTEQLFQNKMVIITADEQTATSQMAAQFWQDLGATSCTFMNSDTHDLTYAYVSHLPQLVAFAMAQPFLQHLHKQTMSANQHNFYRLCGSSAELWLGIFEQNAHIADAAETMLRLISHMITELKDGALNTQQTTIDMEIGLKLAPRIIASCLISCATLTEKKHNLKMARYAGAGFADMTHPAMTDPADDLALISERTNDVVLCLELFEDNLRQILIAIKQQNWTKLGEILSSSHAQYLNFVNT